MKCNTSKESGGTANNCTIYCTSYAAVTAYSHVPPYLARQVDFSKIKIKNGNKYAEIQRISMRML
ncbi:TPA: hypothetical protein ACY39A_000447 [Pasteurella multocida]